MKSKTQTDKLLAERWACTTRTIRNWRKAHAPLKDDSKMWPWLASQRSIPEGTQGILDRHRAESLKGESLREQTLPTGAAQALKRLEEMEARYFTELLEAMKSGDSVRTKLARDNWLKTSEQLRKADMVIEADRRQAGELIPRKDVEFLLRHFGQAHYYAARGMELAAGEVVGLKDIVEVFQVLKRTASSIARTALGDLRGWNARTKSNAPNYPAWMLDAISQGLSNANDGDAFWWRDAKEWEERLGAMLARVTAEQAGAERERLAKIEAAKKRLNDYIKTKPPETLPNTYTETPEERRLRAELKSLLGY